MAEHRHEAAARSREEPNETYPELNATRGAVWALANEGTMKLKQTFAAMASAIFRALAWQTPDRPSTKRALSPAWPTSGTRRKWKRDIS